MPAAPRILVVDDTTANRDVLRALFETQLWTVLEANDGVEALALLEREPVDLIITDILMPRMDGYRLCHEIRANSKLRDVPVIVFTSTHTSPSDENLSIEIGADKFLRKPAGGGSVLAAVRELLASAGQPRAQSHSPREETALIKEYNERLVAKLMEKNLELTDANDALRHSEERLNTVLENLSEGLILATLEGTLLHWNRAALEMHEFANGEEARERLADFASVFELLTLEGGVLPLAEWPLARIIRGERLRELELQVRRRDRPWTRIFSYGGALVPDAGGAPLAFLTVRDVTAQSRAEAAIRESEERLRVLIENASDLITVIDEDGKIGYQSPSTTRLLGYSIEEMAGSDIRRLLHPDDVAKVSSALGDVLAQAGRAQKLEIRFRRSDQSWRIFESMAKSFVDVSGRRMVIVNSRDMTESRRLEDQFRQAQKMEAIGTLAGGIAHDFNNILAAISGYTELARMSVETDSPLERHLTAVLKASRRATDLVRQIMAFSRQQAQQRRPMQLGRIVDEAVSLLRATIPATVAFRVDIAHDVPSVLADPTQVHQVVMNLCTNAWQAMEASPGQLEVRLEAVTLDQTAASVDPALQAGRYVRLVIADTGTGMDPETITRIFEPFFTTKEPGRGTGLGLSVVHGIVQSHDGAITVQSQRGVGTTFHVYFPALPDTMPEVETRVAPVPRGAGQRVMIVDDEEALAQMMSYVLTSLGYVTEAFTDPLVVLNAVKTSPRSIDLVVTDLAMPGISGTDLAVQLLKIRADLPIVLTTGFTANLTEERVRQLGIRELVTKPPTVHSLGTAVHRALSTKRSAGAALILLVEDDDALRDMLGQAIRSRGHKVIEARNGREAWNEANRQAVDLVVTDLVMPEKEGLELIQDLKKKYAALKIIAMSGGGRGGASAYLALARRLGAMDVLEKPFSNDQLFVTIDRALER